MRVTHLTRHFVERWETGDGDPSRRIHIPLDIEIVNNLLAESLRVLRQRTIYLRENGRYIPHVQLAAYWHPTFHLLIKVDVQRRVAVTVINRRQFEQQQMYCDVKVGGTD